MSRRLFATIGLAGALLFGGILPAALANPPSPTSCGTAISGGSPTLSGPDVLGLFHLGLSETFTDSSGASAPACPNRYTYSFSYAPSYGDKNDTVLPHTFTTNSSPSFTPRTKTAATWAITLAAVDVSPPQTDTCGNIYYQVLAKGAITDNAGSPTDVAPDPPTPYLQVKTPNCGSGGSGLW